MLKTRGNKKITSVIIVRTPISNILYQLLNNLTLGQLEQRLKIIINNKYSMEKESTIKFTNNNILNQILKLEK